MIPSNITKRDLCVKGKRYFAPKPMVQFVVSFHCGSDHQSYIFIQYMIYTYINTSGDKTQSTTQKS